MATFTTGNSQTGNPLRAQAADGDAEFGGRDDRIHAPFYPRPAAGVQRSLSAARRLLPRKKAVRFTQFAPRPVAILQDSVRNVGVAKERQAHGPPLFVE
jgi:hypothetical protein